MMRFRGATAAALALTGIAWGSSVRGQNPFLMALRQAGAFVRIAPVQAAPHFWFSEPLDEPHSFVGSIAPRVLPFLRDRL